MLHPTETWQLTYIHSRRVVSIAWGMGSGGPSRARDPMRTHLMVWLFPRAWKPAKPLGIRLPGWENDVHILP
jgi:hypothetical protein